MDINYPTDAEQNYSAPSTLPLIELKRPYRAVKLRLRTVDPPGTDWLPGSIPQHRAGDPEKWHAVWADGETHNVRWHGKIEGVREDGRETKSEEMKEGEKNEWVIMRPSFAAPNHITMAAFKMEE